MTPIQNGNALRKRFRSLEKKKRYLKRAERMRRMRVRRLRLHQRLKLDVHLYQEKRKKERIEKKKKRIARRETAKLNRTLKRRRKG